ncbi:hypothetical protein G4Y79_07535 [Phototrophicus methaneseepsis]|uniref:Uncharacterized protein n=1 Tax=Phototrophicus methaneseepsis TaxID=2710758 RepID=A0A7S8EC19_9CHLR|nr:hypothetical protein [Phototrophicus methaneseepsis]QPC84215.1 hypothetical protein G4Y79_07535 [Phototrophicus methaneseepsis]
MGDSIYNFITGLALLATVAVVGGLIYLFSQPNPYQESLRMTQLALLPTQAVFPSSTPSNTPTITPIPSSTRPPTFTPTFTETLSPTPSATFTPTVTVSPTITDTPGATATPTITSTPTVTPTFTLTPTPTGPTAIPTATTSPFLFNLREPLSFSTNFANAAGCLWQGAGGAVYGIDGQPIPLDRGYVVHIFNDFVDRTAVVGTNSQYGAVSGWEIALDTQPNTQLYFVVLESTIGTEISPRIQVQFPGTCEGNTAILNFRQQR